MSIVSIVQLPTKVLREKAREVSAKEITSPRIQELISRMKKTLAASENGVGLAAPQIGESLQIFLVSEEAEEIDKGRPPTVTEASPPQDPETKLQKRTWRYDVFINPKIKKISRKKNEFPEGCLSVVGKFGIVPRPEKITVEAYDENGKKFVRSATKFVARVIQHELDHLQGVLFIDKATQMLASEHNTS
ncbi:MAG: peptide deformylase [bacterium]|nr:peptide deformylase [bacterium]